MRKKSIQQHEKGNEGDYAEHLQQNAYNHQTNQYVNVVETERGHPPPPFSINLLFSTYTNFDHSYLVKIWSAI